MILMKPIFLFNFFSGFTLYSLSLYHEGAFLLKIMRMRFTRDDNIDKVIPLIFFSSNTSNFFAYFVMKCWLGMGLSENGIFVDSLVLISNISNCVEILGFAYIIRKMYQVSGITIKFLVYSYLSLWFTIMFFISIINPNTYFNVFCNPAALLSKNDMNYIAKQN